MGIDIGQVLREINVKVDGDKPVEFEISFVKVDGTVKHCKRASGSVKVSKRPGAAQPQKLNYNHKDKGTVLIYDHVKKDYNSVKIGLIIQFNGQRVCH